MIDDELQTQKHLLRIATPSRLAMAMSKRVMGRQWQPYPWVLHVEREILAMMQRPGNEVMIVSVPPQEGKSTFSCLWFPSWYIGTNPDDLVILVGYNDEFISGWGVKCRNFMDQYGMELFGVGLDKSQMSQSNWRTSRGFGGMLAAGILGGITGNPGHLVIIDDVIKTMEDALSVGTKRKHLGEWDGSISARFQENTKVLITATRWAEDDLSGEIIARSLADDYDGYPINVVAVKAQAEPDEIERLTLDVEELAHWTDFLGRREGEYLEGQHSTDFFRRRKASVGNYTWSTLYQASPTSLEGSMFPRDAWRWFNPDDRPRMVSKFRVWDLAGSEGQGDYSVGALVGRDVDENWYVLDVQRFQHSGDRVMVKVKAAATGDGWGTPIRIEEERNGSGKSILSLYRKELLGRDIDKVKAEGDKVGRFMPYSTLQQLNRVYLPKRPDGTVPDWVGPFVEEHRQQQADGRGPKHDDQIDAVAHAIIEMMARGHIEIVNPNDRIVDMNELDLVLNRLGQSA